MCQIWFNNVYQRNDSFHANHGCTRKFCGFMSLRAGSSLACTIWLGISIYMTVLAFEGVSPIYSYADDTSLKIQIAACVLLAFVSFITLAGLFGDSIRILHHSHRLVFIAIFLFVIDFLANIIVAGIQKDSYNNWCVSNSLGSADENVTINLANGTNYNLTLTNTIDLQIFNCYQLWQDEIKFACIIFVVCAPAFCYWAICIWSYCQKLLMIQHQKPMPV